MLSSKFGTYAEGINYRGLGEIDYSDPFWYEGMLAESKDAVDVYGNSVPSTPTPPADISFENLSKQIGDIASQFFKTKSTIDQMKLQNELLIKQQKQGLTAAELNLLRQLQGTSSATFLGLSMTTWLLLAAAGFAAYWFLIRKQ